MATKNASLQAQEVFIQHLKGIVPNNISLANDVAEILGLSLDSAYRRLRNETELTLTETYQLCKHYRVSVDALFSNQTNAVTCDYNKLTKSPEDFSKYLSSLHQQIIQIQKMPQVRMIYAAEEVPIFRSFHSDKLTAFKLFYWQRSVLNIPHLQTIKFDWQVVPKQQLALAKKMNQVYMQVPSTEIWTTETIQTDIKQIEYYYESGLFKNKDDALALLAELKDMIALINHQAEHERKSETHKASFSLYSSDLIIGTNCIHIQNEFNSLSYLSFNTFNSLSTSNKPFCEEIEQWMKNLIKKSTLISGVAEKQRFQFFNKIYKSIDVSMERIKNY